jgi:hypothetical protein
MALVRFFEFIVGWRNSAKTSVAKKTCVLLICTRHCDRSQFIEHPRSYSEATLTGAANARATDDHFLPDKPAGATCKSLIFLDRWLSLN